VNKIKLKWFLDGINSSKRCQTFLQGTQYACVIIFGTK